jgi:hypothetical protein
MSSLFKTLALSFVLVGSFAQAKTISITCGSDTNAIYDALEQNDLSKAEFSTVISLRGMNNPASLTSMSDDFRDQTGSVKSISVDSVSDTKSVTLMMNTGNKYEISGLSCDSLDSSTGKVTYSKATPRGFVGYEVVASAKCNCVAK